MNPRILISIIAIITSLLLCAAADAKVKPGLYTGKTSDGHAVKIRVKKGRVTASVKVRVDCVRFTGFDPSAKPESSSSVDRLVTEDDESVYVPLSGSAFSFSDDAIESGTGGEGSQTTIDGSFRGSRVTGSAAYESSFNSQATGSNGSCGGSASYTARRVPGS